MNDQVTARERWMGAVCYVPLLVFVAIFSAGRTAFTARHIRQGFALLLAEIVGLVFIWIIDGTIGRIPLIGFVVVIALRLAFFLSVLVISVLGFTKAMFGEDWRIPYLDELADRVPVE